MARLVMKFGGTSVADVDRIRNVARHVKREVDAGHAVAVVVSAMAGVTNELVGWCREAAPLHDAREYDAIVASGEQVTAGLLAMTLEGIGVNARSWQGWQLPIATSNAHGAARILDVNGAELIKRFKERSEVAVIAGFQGVHPETGRITTLGRGGSTPRLSRSPRRSTRNAATSTPTSTASTPPTRASCRRRAGCPRSPMRRCSSSPRSAQKFCRCVRSSSPWCRMCASWCARASTSLRTSTRAARRPER
jgi:hypothetical protein